MKVFNDEAALALATLSVDQLVRTKGSGSATDGQTILWRIAASGVGITLANGNVAIALVNDKSGRKNFLINGNFNIWQRGNGAFTDVGLNYTADRWTTQNANTDVFQNSAAGSKPLDSIYALQVFQGDEAIVQGIELPLTGDAGIFQIGSVFTFSGWVDPDNTGDIGVGLIFRDNANITTNEIAASTPVITPVTATLQKITATFTITGAVNPTNTSLSVVIYKNAGALTDFNISQVQLEKGSAATEFEYRPIAEELALCQRYFELSTSVGDPDRSFWRGDITLGANYEGVTYYKQDKRAIPSVILTNFSASGFGATVGAVTLGISAFSETRSATVTGSSGQFISTWTADAEL